MEQAAALKGELIGKNIEVIDSTNRAQSGAKGKVIDETKGMITIRDEKGNRKKLIKNTITIKVNGAIIRGEDIHAAPEERIKLKRK